MRLQKRVFLPSAVALLLSALTLIVVACGTGSSGGTYGGAGGGGNATPTATPSASSGGSGGAAQQVTIENFSYGPASLTIKAGTTVVWTNRDSAPHTVTSTDGPGVDAKTTGDFDSGSLSQGDTFEFTFDTPGTYNYVCTFHASMPSMHAEVTVE